MKPTEFARYLTEFLTTYLSGQKNVSKNTILAYRDTFKLLLKYCKDIKNLSPERLEMNDLSSDLIVSFLDWLEKERNCIITTRNHRLAAIHSFFRYVQTEDPSGIYHFQKIIAIPIKKTLRTVVNHLSLEATKLLLEQPDRNSSKGKRDLVLLCLLYDTGARVQELIDIKICDLILDTQAVVILTGKGNKTRRVPILKNTASMVKKYLVENKLNLDWKNQYYLFTNSQNNKFTKEGISYIINKYVKSARNTSTIIPTKVNPHMLRHSKAMHLLQAGVNLIYIRDFLGHVDIKTTEIYASTDTETKRKAIEKSCPNFIDSTLPDWNNNQELLMWLNSLK